MERDSVTARLTDIADVLRHIDALEEARAIEDIRNGLSGAINEPVARAIPDPIAVAAKPAKRTVRQRVKTTMPPSSMRLLCQTAFR